MSMIKATKSLWMRREFKSISYDVPIRRSRSSQSCWTSSELHNDLTFVIRCASLIFMASSRALFQSAASQKRSYFSSGIVTRSMYFMISDTPSCPLIAARANGLNPIGDLVLESANIRRLAHSLPSANALTFTCHSLFSGTRNFFPSLSTSASKR